MDVSVVYEKIDDKSVSGNKTGFRGITYIVWKEKKSCDSDVAQLVLWKHAIHGLANDFRWFVQVHLACIELAEPPREPANIDGEYRV